MNQSQEKRASYPHVFNYPPGNIPVRVRLISEMPWFAADDVSGILAPQKDTSECLSYLEHDEKMVFSFSDELTQLINESGLYRLIFCFRNSDSGIFRKWITLEVLPSLHGRKKKKADRDFIDLRGEPYSREMFNEYPVRVIEYKGIKMYLLNDILRGINARTDSYRTVRKLEAQKKTAAKILIYGNTHPAWFVSPEGVRLITAGSKTPKETSGK